MDGGIDNCILVKKSKIDELEMLKPEYKAAYLGGMQ